MSFSRPFRPQGFHSISRRRTQRLEEKTYKDLVKKLDQEVSFYVKHTFEVAPGICRCYTCGALHEISDIQWGHYISRRYYAVRWDLRNSRPQCKGCNGPRKGDPLKFRANLVEDIGAANVEDLEFKARFHGERTSPREWIIEEIRRYLELNRKFRRNA